jgi:hypothetical protein
MSGWKFVFCEGKDDLAVIRCLAEFHGITGISVEELSGKDKLRSLLKAIRMRPEFAQNKVASIGVIRDADDDDRVAFESVRDALLANGFAAPENSGSVTGQPIKIGVLIIRPNAGKGMLEDLCLKSVSDRPEFDCVDEYFRCVAEKSDRKSFSSKAKVRAWLSSHTDWDLRVGLAAEKGYWPWDNPAFDTLKDFIRAL